MKFKKGDRVKIRRDSEYAEQNEGVGTITRIYDKDKWASVAFDDSYHNGYRTGKHGECDLELAELTPLKKLGKLCEMSAVDKYMALRLWPRWSGNWPWDVANDKGDVIGSAKTPEEAIDEAYEKVCVKKPKGDDMAKKKLSDTEKLQKLGERVDGEITIRHNKDDEYQLAHNGECITGEWEDSLPAAIEAAYKTICPHIPNNVEDWEYDKRKKRWTREGTDVRCIGRVGNSGHYEFEEHGPSGADLDAFQELKRINPKLLPPTED